MGSISFLALLLIVFFIIPVAIFKIGYDLKIPLIKHDFSLLLEAREFYFPVFLSIILLSEVFYFVDLYTPLDPACFNLLNRIIFGPTIGISLHEFFNAQAGIFVSILYGSNFFIGRKIGDERKRQVREHIGTSRPLYELKQHNLIGLWAAVLFCELDSVTMSLDILTDGDLLYSGDLYHYETNDSEIKTIILKNTSRFLVPLNEVSGKNEKKYLIPGEFTYFFVSKIKNINIKKIVKESGKFVFWGELVRSQIEVDEAFKLGLKKALENYSSSKDYITVKYKKKDSKKDKK